MNIDLALRVAVMLGSPYSRLDIDGRPAGISYASAATAAQPHLFRRLVQPGPVSTLLPWALLAFPPTMQMSGECCDATLHTRHSWIAHFSPTFSPRAEEPRNFRAGSSSPTRGSQLPPSKKLPWAFLSFRNWGELVY